MSMAQSIREGRVYRHQRKNPSFSSSLLDEIYRSIDEGNKRDGDDEEMVFYREPMKAKQSITSVNQRKEEDEEMGGVRRAGLVDKWMGKKVSVKVNNRSSMVFNSSSSSSDSCCGSGFSSSEAESVYGTRSTTTKTTSSCSSSRPKPVRTNVSVEEKKFSSSSKASAHQEEKSNHFNGFIKTKSRALKIYGDLKKVKQPISPGGRLATFINSLFNPGTPKKGKLSTTTTTSVQDSNFDRKSTQTSTCSSVSSFSRSCLSKTPSSSTTQTTKRSVRFYPVSVIVDEDSRPCGHKCLYEDEPRLMAATKVRKISESAVPIVINEELKLHIMEKNRRIEEAARNLLLRKKKSNFDIRDLINYEDEDDDDDAASCSSSDLFELDNLERYREELPVYETTHLSRNRAIANGLIV